jgi:hypothetical protein
MKTPDGGYIIGGLKLDSIFLVDHTRYLIYCLMRMDSKL